VPKTRRKSKTPAPVQFSARLPAPTAARVEELAERTGWTSTRAAVLLIDLAAACLAFPAQAADRLADGRRYIEQAADLAAAQQKAAAIVREARAKVRKAAGKMKGAPAAAVDADMPPPSGGPNSPQGRAARTKAAKAGGGA